MSADEVNLSVLSTIVLIPTSNRGGIPLMVLMKVARTTSMVAKLSCNFVYTCEVL